jgi:uncharacterized membrane-anchored protein
MMEDQRLKGRLAALFFAGCVAFCYPLLAAFNVSATVFGLPVLYVYVFGAWTAFIVLAALAARSRD